MFEIAVAGCARLIISAKELFACASVECADLRYQPLRRG
jgi:hypothetical protein